MGEREHSLGSAGTTKSGRGGTPGEPCGGAVSGAECSSVGVSEPTNILAGRDVKTMNAGAIRLSHMANPVRRLTPEIAREYRRRRWRPVADDYPNQE